jgi:hypothetical protein
MTTEIQKWKKVCFNCGGDDFSGHWGRCKACSDSRVRVVRVEPEAFPQEVKQAEETLKSFWSSFPLVRAWQRRMDRVARG